MWWDSTLGFIGTIAVPILIAGATAWWTHRLQSRRRAWETILSLKLASIQAFFDALRSFVVNLHYASALDQAARLPNRADKMASLLMLVQRMRPEADAWTNRSLDVIERIAPPISGSVEQDERLIQQHGSLMVAGLHNQIGNQAVAAVQRVQTAYAALSMHCFDPSKPARIKEHVVELANAVVASRPGESSPDYDQTFEKWRALHGQAVAYLRLDMNKSYRGFRQATAMKQSWLDERKRDIDET